MALSYFDILTARFRIINYAWPGFPFSDGTNAGQLGLRKAAKFTPDAVVRKSTEGREWQDAMGVKAEVELLQDDYSAFKNWMLLSQVFAQYQFELSNGKYLNLAETNAITPSNALCLSVEPEFECTPTDLMLKGVISGKIYGPEWETLINDMTAWAGGTGGTAAGMTQMTYDPTAYGIPGISDVLIGTTTATETLGVRNNTKVSIKFAKQDEDERMRGIVRKAVVDIEMNMLQSNQTQLQLLDSYKNSDFALKVILVNGMTLYFHECVSITNAPNYDDQKTFIKVKLTGEIPFDPLGGSEANIVFDDVTSTVHFYQVGYAV